MPLQNAGLELISCAYSKFKRVAFLRGFGKFSVAIGFAESPAATGAALPESEWGVDASETLILQNEGSSTKVIP